MRSRLSSTAFCHSTTWLNKQPISLGFKSKLSISKNKSFATRSIKSGVIALKKTEYYSLLTKFRCNMFIRRNETNNRVLHNCTERFVQLKRIHTSVISYFQLFYSISPKTHTILNYQLPYLTFKRILSHLTTKIPKCMILITIKIRVLNTLEKLK